MNRGSPTFISPPAPRVAGTCKRGGKWNKRNFISGRAAGNPRPQRLRRSCWRAGNPVFTSYGAREYHWYSRKTLTRAAEIRTAKNMIPSCFSPPEGLIGNAMSGRWESNPVYTHPKRVYYRHTPARLDISNFRFMISNLKFDI